MCSTPSCIICRIVFVVNIPRFLLSLCVHMSSYVCRPWYLLHKQDTSICMCIFSASAQMHQKFGWNGFQFPHLSFANIWKWTSVLLMIIEHYVAKEISLWMKRYIIQQPQTPAFLMSAAQMKNALTSMAILVADARVGSTGWMESVSSQVCDSKYSRLVE